MHDLTLQGGSSPSGGDGLDALLAEDCRDLVCSGSALLGGPGIHPYFCGCVYSGGRGIKDTQCHLAVFDDLITGGRGTSGDQGGKEASEGGIGDHGAVVDDLGFFFAVGCTFQGGVGGAGGTNYFGCSPFDGGIGGSGLVVNSVSPTMIGSLVACDLSGATGGTGGGSSTCGMMGVHGASGSPFLGHAASLSMAAGPRRSFHAPIVVREHENVPFTVIAPPGERVLLLVSLTPDYSLSAAVDGPLLLGLPATRYAMGTTGPSGSLTRYATIRELGPGAVSAVRYLQAALVDAQGNVHLTGPSTLVVLDGSL